MRVNRIYPALSRPPQVLGVPTFPLLIVVGVSAFTLMLVHWLPGVVIGTFGYLALAALFGWEPQFLTIVQVVSRKTPRTKNRRIHGGADRYEA